MRRMDHLFAKLSAEQILRARIIRLVIARAGTGRLCYGRRHRSVSDRFAAIGLAGSLGRGLLAGRVGAYSGGYRGHVADQASAQARWTAIRYDTRTKMLLELQR